MEGGVWVSIAKISVEVFLRVSAETFFYTIVEY